MLENTIERIKLRNFAKFVIKHYDPNDPEDLESIIRGWEYSLMFCPCCKEKIDNPTFTYVLCPQCTKDHYAE